jgi:predicted cupin superfamily sugar epimerase
MDPRVEDLTSLLGLTAHPEGGYFREVYRSASRVQPSDERSERAAITIIYYLLVRGEVSRWHRVASDEVWQYHEGDPLELFAADAGFNQVTRHVLGRLDEGGQPAHVIQADWWQAARSMGAYTLAGCTVGPGFEFADFQLLRDQPLEEASMRRRHPAMARFI